LRTPKSICLLCQENLAIKENSHIIPKFMTKSILGHEKVKKVYLVRTTTGHKAPVFSQDTAKEDFILCDSCEQFFSILETYIATRVHNRLRNMRHYSEFSKNSIEPTVSMKVCEQINPNIFDLFICSIIWRCSISETQLCKGFSLSVENEESLRTILFLCKFEKQKDLFDNVDGIYSPIPSLAYSLFTADNFEDKSENNILIHPFCENPYKFILNEYMLIFSFTKNEKQQRFDFFNNYGNSKIKIGFYTKVAWKNMQRKIVQLAIDETNRNLKESGEIAWVNKKE
jgi:hypothetical protein